MGRAEAEDFLEQMGKEMLWDETDLYPLPPLTRGELATLFLQELQLIDDSPGAPLPIKWDQHWFEAIPVDWLRHSDSDRLTDDVWRRYGKPKCAGELFEILETIYLSRWERGWRCGGCDDAKANVEQELSRALRQVSQTNHLTFDHEDRLSDRLTAQQGHELSYALDWVGYEGRSLLVRQGPSQVTAILTGCLLLGGLSLILLTLLGSLKVELALSGFVVLLGLVWLSSRYIQHTEWKDPTLTIGGYIEALHQRAYEEFLEMQSRDKIHR